LAAKVMEANLFWFHDEQRAKIVPHFLSNQPGPKRRRILSGFSIHRTAAMTGEQIRSCHMWTAPQGVP
jgi:hypothetical protein